MQGWPLSLILLSSLLLTQCAEEKDSPLSQLAQQGYSLSIGEFHRAARDGDTTALALMLRAGISVNVTDKEGHTALHEAAEHARVEAVESLLAAGASTFTGAQGSLTYAVRGRSSAIIRSLLLKDPRLCADAATLLPLLSETGPYQAVQALLQTAHISASLDALLAAAKGGDTAVIDLLMQSGASPWQQHPETGMTALMQAAHYGHAPAVELLLNAGSNRFAIDVQGLCALDHAATEEVKHRLSSALTQNETRVHVPVDRLTNGSGLTEVRNSLLPDLIRLEGCTLPARAGMLPSDALYLREVCLASLPCMITEVKGDKLILNDGREILPGVEILNGWKLLVIRQRPSGPEWWRQEALVINDSLNQRQIMLEGIPPRSGLIVAELRSTMSAVHEYECRVGDSFVITDSQWKVSGICPDRVQLVETVTGRTSIIRWKGKQ